MNMRRLVALTAERAGVPPAQAAAVLSAFREVVRDAVTGGDEVVLPGLVRLTSRWTDAREVRQPDGRRVRLDGRFVPRVVVSQALRAQMAARTPQTWRDPRQQAAWRLAQTLVGDLAAYHPGVTPRVHEGCTWEEADAAMRVAFHGAWERVIVTWDRDVPAEVRAGSEHLLHAVRRTWPDNPRHRADLAHPPN